MALIYFYDATELDKAQINDVLNETDHNWEFVSSKIETSNCNLETEVISVFVTSTVTREILESLPKLKLIACRSTGFNNIDLVAAEERGITVVNVPSYGENTVAEYAFTLLLALTRKMTAVLETQGKSFSTEDLRGHDLEGKTIGIIGTGHIGQKALRIANGFSMHSIAYDPYPKEELQQSLNFRYVSLDELLAESDIISLHTPYLPSTHHLINGERLKKMKRGSILINTARGELVDTRALTEQLDNGYLGGAAIDVIEGEALLSHHEETAMLRSEMIPESLLRHSMEISLLEKLPNVIISPHNAFNTEEAIKRINLITSQNIIDFWYGTIPNKVEIPKKNMGKLLVARHAESEWNASGRWTGKTDVHLSPKGFKESVLFGQALKKSEIKVDLAYCSEQIRTRETLEGMLNTAQLLDVAIIVSPSINERDYGEYTGKNKWEMKELIGEEAFNNLRRGWDVPIPNGESLKNVYERVIPFFQDTILPQLKEGKNILLVAHGNSIRALIKYIESISDEDVSHLEMIFGQIIIYELDDAGHKLNSSTLDIDTSPPNA